MCRFIYRCVACQRHVCVSCASLCVDVIARSLKAAPSGYHSSTHSQTQLEKETSTKTNLEPQQLLLT